MPPHAYRHKSVTNRYIMYNKDGSPRCNLSLPPYPTQSYRWVKLKEVPYWLQSADSPRSTVVTPQIYFTSKRCLNIVRCRMGWDFAISFMQYGEKWKKCRKPFQEHFRATEIYKHMPTQRREIHTFLRRLLSTPEDFVHHIHQ